MNSACGGGGVTKRSFLHFFFLSCVLINRDTVYVSLGFATMKKEKKKT